MTGDGRRALEVRMAWIESHQNLGRHPKLVRLALLLRIHKAQAVGHLQFLWWWALDYAPTGSLSAFTPAEISAGAEWPGEPGPFHAALLECGWIDSDGQIHDWHEYAGKYVETRAYDRERKRVQRMSSGCPPEVHPESGRTNNTNQPTKPTKPTNPAAAALPPGLCVPEFESAWADWLQHRREIKHPLTPTAASQQLRKLEGWGPKRAVEALRHSMANGWQGVFEPDGRVAKPTKATALERARAALAEDLETP